jgi:hypothetical protein
LLGPLDDRVLDRIVAEARGNPLARRELATAGAFGQHAGGFAVSLVDGRGEALFSGRLESLPSETRLLLLLAAAEPLGVLLWRAAELLGLAPVAAEPAEAIGLIGVGTRGPLLPPARPLGDLPAGLARGPALGVRRPRRRHRRAGRSSSPRLASRVRGSRTGRGGGRRARARSPIEPASAAG